MIIIRATENSSPDFAKLGAFLIFISYGFTKIFLSIPALYLQYAEILLLSGPILYAIRLTSSKVDIYKFNNFNKKAKKINFMYLTWMTFDFSQIGALWLLYQNPFANSNIDLAKIIFIAAATYSVAYIFLSFALGNHIAKSAKVLAESTNAT